MSPVYSNFLAVLWISIRCDRVAIFSMFFFFWANTHQIDLTKEGRTINQEEEKVQEYFGIQVIQN